MISSPALASQRIARYVRSDRDPSRFYVVALNPRGFWECECPAATFYLSKRCKYVAAVAKDGAGLAAQPKRQCDPLRVQVSAAGRELADLLQV